MATEKYPNGYMPKIEYWTQRLVDAVKNEDIYEIDHCHNKMDYFIEKQYDLQWGKKTAYENILETVA